VQDPQPEKAVVIVTRSAGYAHARDPEAAFCTIRNLPIEDPFYTYCGNHPHRRPERDPIPIGPVFTGDSSGARRFWERSPNTEEVRRHLLNLLAGIGQEPSSEYPIGVYVDELVVWPDDHIPGRGRSGARCRNRSLVRDREELRWSIRKKSFLKSQRRVMPRCYRIFWSCTSTISARCSR